MDFYEALRKAKIAYARRHRLKVDEIYNGFTVTNEGEHRFSLQYGSHPVETYNYSAWRIRRVTEDK